MPFKIVLQRRRCRRALERNVLSGATIYSRQNHIVSIDFGEDETLRQEIKTHIEALIPRLRFKNRILNEVLSVVKNEYTPAFQIQC